MTAINVFLYADAAVVMTDGLAAEADGSNSCLTHKVLPLAHLHAVVAARGPVFLLQAIGQAISQGRRTFDDAAANLGADLRMTVEGLRRRHRVEDAHLHLIGRSEASGEFQSWAAMSEPHHHLAAYEAVRTGTMMQPWPGDCDTDTQNLARLATVDLGEFDPETDGVALMQGQMRRYPEQIGGYCQITTINATEITTRVLCRWPETGGLA